MRLFFINNRIRIQLFIFLYLIVISQVYSQNEDYSPSVLSINEYFTATYKSKIEPIPLNKIHQWIVHINNQEGIPVENAIIQIEGGMPAHNHGLPTQPRATEIGNGDYLIEGIKFSMTGSWEIWLHIQQDTVIDKIKFNLTF